MKRWLTSYLGWQVVLCVLGIGVCLLPTRPRTGAFWGLLRGWTSLTPDKVRISSVDPGSPADRAGLRSGDAVVAVNGQRLNGVELFDDALQGLRPGSSVGLRVERDGQQIDVMAVGREPEVEAILYYRAQAVALLVLLTVAVFLVATQPLRPTPLWRPLVVLVIGFAGAVLVVAGLIWRGPFGWGPFGSLEVAQWWLIDNDPDFPRLAIQGVCLAVALGLLVTATLEVRAVVARKVAEREAMAALRKLAAVPGKDEAAPVTPAESGDIRSESPT